MICREKEMFFRLSSNSRGRPDFLLLFLTVVLVSFGLVMIFSASYPVAVVKHAVHGHYFHKQVIFSTLGLFIMFLFMGIPYTAWKKIGVHLMIAALLLLLLTLIVGANINGAKRWIVMGGINFQPAEFAKLAIIVYFAALISKKGEQRIRSFRKGVAPFLITTSIMLLLVMKQPDFGSALILGCISAVMIWIGGIALRHLFIISLAVIPIFIYLAFSKSYRLKRISSFLNPFDDYLDSGYQLIQSYYALGHGGLTGTGFGRSIQKHFYLPEAHTDFIFAVVGEEFGYIGSALLVIVFFLFIWRGYRSATKCSNPFGMLLGVGIVSMIGIQIVLNLGAATGCLPITGVPLPFISYGGSSMIICMASTGILLSISRDNNKRLGEL